MGPVVNNNDLFSVKVLCKTLTAAYISVTTHCIVFVLGHDIFVAFLVHEMSK